MTDLVAFTVEHVCQLTGLSNAQLRHWDRSGVLSPYYGDEASGRPYGRVYSFRDLVGLRTLARLRERGVPLQELRRVGQWLAERYEAPWSSLRFFDDPCRGTRVLGPPGQTAFPFEMEQIAADTQAATAMLRERQPEDIGRVARHRYVMHNAPVVAGTRIPTAAIWDFYRAGHDQAAILREYPRLTPADISTAIAYERDRRERGPVERQAV
jgi:uncharacterized protein (DUF433 family)